MREARGAFNFGRAMLVNKKNFMKVLAIIVAHVKRGDRLGMDVETYGLFWWKTPHAPWYKPGVFSVQFACENGREYYFDFCHSLHRLNESHFALLQEHLFSRTDAYYFIHNAKFELHQLANHSINILGTIHCTQSIARLVHNCEPKLSLDYLCTKYFRLPKMDVQSYIQENRLFTLVDRSGAPAEQFQHYDRLPLPMLIEYGCLDAAQCLWLGMWQVDKIKARDTSGIFANSGKTLSTVLENENALNKVSFRMERYGVNLDLQYCKEAYAFYCAAYAEIEKCLNATLEDGEEKINWNSAADLTAYFKRRNIQSYKVTTKGSASYDRDALEQMDNDAARKIVRYRYHHKRAHTYFGNYLWLADTFGVLHCSIRNEGAETGRQSVWSPSMQNIPKRGDKDEANYKVRRCFIPRTEEGFFFCDKDYTGAEFYVAMDYAGEMPVIERLKLGLDPHTFTREKINGAVGREILKSRDAAKTMTFRLIYGAGDEAVGVSCGFSKGWEAKTNGKLLKNTFFSEFPEFGKFMARVKDAAGLRGYLFNWMGRVLEYVPGGWPLGTSYKAPNGLIQGSIGDTLKLAMVRIDAEFLRINCRSRMLLPVHDAVLFEIAYGEEWILDVIHSIMVEAYPHKHIQLKADASFSDQSWANLVDAVPKQT